MSRAYEQHIEKSELLERIAVELELLVECEFHDAEYYDSGCSFEDVELDIAPLLKSYKLSSSEQENILNALKTIQVDSLGKCSFCVF